MTQSSKELEMELIYAVRDGYLPIGATAKELTGAIRKEMDYACLIQDAVTWGLLPIGTKPKELTDSIRGRMSDNACPYKN